MTDGEPVFLPWSSSERPGKLLSLDHTPHRIGPLIQHYGPMQAKPQRRAVTAKVQIGLK